MLDAHSTFFSQTTPCRTVIQSSVHLLCFRFHVDSFLAGGACSPWGARCARLYALTSGRISVCFLSLSTPRGRTGVRYSVLRINHARAPSIYSCRRPEFFKVVATHFLATLPGHLVSSPCAGRRGREFVHPTPCGHTSLRFGGCINGTGTPTPPAAPAGPVAPPAAALLSNGASARLGVDDAPASLTMTLPFMIGFLSMP